MKRINVSRINAGILLAVGLITSGCTTNRIQVDDHSYHHNDVPPTNTTVIHHHHPQPPAPPRPTVEQIDQDFLQYQQTPTSANTYTPSRYPPVIPGSLYYPTAAYYNPTYTYRHSTPGYSTNAQAYKAQVRLQFGL